MRKIFTCMLTMVAALSFAATPALKDFPAFSFDTNDNGRLNTPAAKQAKPVELKEFKNSTYDCAYFDWWYFGSEEAYFGYVLFNEEGKEVAFTVLSASETDYVTSLDGVAFKDDHEDRDVSSHYYISTYWILNSLNGVRLGGNEEDQTIVANHIMEVKDNDNNSVLALRSGTYYLRVYEFLYDGTNMSIGSGYAQIKFTLNSLAVKDLKAEVAKDNKTATISWTEPAAEDMPAGVHLYMSVQSGGNAAYDNYSKKTSPENPLTVNVSEGRTYSVSAQYVGSKNAPAGSAVVIYFTVGTNEYIPTDAKAVVTKDDYVDFTWKAAKQAEYYHVNVYQAGITYASYTTTEPKLTKQIPTGTYSWEVAAYEKDSEGTFYPLTEYIKGNDFTTKTAPLPEGTIELTITRVVAGYQELDASDPDYRAGKHVWTVMLESNSSNGLPEPWITIYSDRQFAISGVYSKDLNNIAFGEQITFMNTTGEEAGLETATDASLQLEFEGFDFEYEQMGYYLPYYSGEFHMATSNGKNYYGRINTLICEPINMADLFSSSPTLIDMVDEDPNYQGIKDVQTDKAQSTKRIENGQLIIEHNGVKYNVLGASIR